MSTINKADLASQVAEKTGGSASEAKAAVDAVLGAITENLKAGNDINLSGFGKFSVAERAARQGVNPATGEKIQIAASKAAKFSAAKALKDAVNG